MDSNLEIVLQLKILRQEAAVLNYNRIEAQYLYESKITKIKELEKKLIIKNLPEYSY